MNKTYICNTLDEAALQHALKLKSNIIIANDSSVPIPQNIKYINSFHQREKGSWLAYKTNTKVLHQLEKKYPALFKIKKYNLFKAYQKLLFWTNWKTGIAHYVADQQQNLDIKYKESLYPASYKRLVVKYILLLLKSYFLKNKNNEQLSKISTKIKYAIFFSDPFELSLLSKLIKLFKKEELILVCHNLSFHSSDKKNTIAAEYDTIYFDKKYNYRIPLINIFKCNKDELNILMHILSFWNVLKNHIYNYEQLANSNIQSILVNAGENEPFANVLCEVVQNKKIKVFNMMNGIKAAEANNKDVQFNKWFVWDHKMKELLINECHVQDRILSVAGNLSEDYIQSHRFSNSINIEIDKIFNKKVISLFSINDNRFEKKELFTFLNNLSRKENYVLLVRRHPLEGKVFFEQNFTNDNPNVFFIKYTDETSKLTLYDQLAISDVAIVLGSTVALEAKWFKVPCISYESSEKSILYCINNEDIFHARNIEDLKSILLNIKKRIHKVDEAVVEVKTVAKKYFLELTE